MTKEQQRINNERLLTLCGFRLDKNNLGWRILRADGHQYISGQDTREDAIDHIDFYYENCYGSWLRERVEEAILKRIREEYGCNGQINIRLPADVQIRTSDYQLDVFLDDAPFETLREAKLAAILAALDAMEQSNRDE